MVRILRALIQLAYRIFSRQLFANIEQVEHCGSYRRAYLLLPDRQTLNVQMLQINNNRQLRSMVEGNRLFLKKALAMKCGRYMGKDTLIVELLVHESAIMSHNQVLTLKKERVGKQILVLGYYSSWQIQENENDASLSLPKLRHFWHNPSITESTSTN